MAQTRSVGLFKALKYQGGGPMLAWILHRIGGLAMLVFVGTHVIASFFMQQTGSDAATTINIIYESVYFQIFIYFFVIFHAINGTRIILMDFWPQLLEYQRQMIWLQWAIFIPIYGMALFVMIYNLITGG